MNYDDAELDEYDEFEEEWQFNCGMDRHGYCGKAGSRECDFECPIMLEIHRKETIKRLRKSKAPRP